MTLLSTRSSRDSKSPPTNHKSSANQSLKVHIELKNSMLQRSILFALTVLALLSPINAQLPWAFIVITWAWVICSFFPIFRHSQRVIELCDEGQTWLLKSRDGAERVRYLQTDYNNAYLIILVFTKRSGATRRLCVWHDAVTDPAFSWISARATLTSADRAVNIVSTSTQRFFHPR